MYNNYNRIRYLTSLKSSITSAFFSLLRKIKVDSYDCFHTEKKLTLHDIIRFIISALNEDQNYCHYNIFLERCSYQ